MKISDLPRTPSYFDVYINQVADLDLSEAFQQSLSVLDSLDLEKLHAIGDRVYAPGKWTIRDLFQHITDTERIFAYRALRFSRNDQTPLPGFDENLYAEYSGANQRPLESVLAELRSVRESSIHLFNSFDQTALSRTGVMFNNEVSVLGVGFTLIGHQIHHLRVLEERYLPILQTA